MAKSFLLLRAYWKLICFDLHLASGDFGRLYRKVQASPLEPGCAIPVEIEQICSAIDSACVWYWKPVFCLQRSAATACLLKEYGVPAQMVIGAQLVPFRSHAWVEVKGKVVNDKAYVKEIYGVLDRC